MAYPGTIIQFVKKYIPLTTSVGNQVQVICNIVQGYMYIHLSRLRVFVHKYGGEHCLLWTFALTNSNVLSQLCFL